MTTDKRRKSAKVACAACGRELASCNGRPSRHRSDIRKGFRRTGCRPLRGFCPGSQRDGERLGDAATRALRTIDRDMAVDGYWNRFHPMRAKYPATWAERGVFRLGWVLVGGGAHTLLAGMSGVRHAA